MFCWMRPLDTLYDAYDSRAARTWASCIGFMKDDQLVCKPTTTSLILTFDALSAPVPPAEAVRLLAIPIFPRWVPLSRTPSLAAADKAALLFVFLGMMKSPNYAWLRFIAVSVSDRTVDRRDPIAQINSERHHTVSLSPDQTRHSI